MLDIGTNNTEKVQKAIAESERLIKSSMCKISYSRSQVIEYFVVMFTWVQGKQYIGIFTFWHAETWKMELSVANTPFSVPCIADHACD